MADRTAALFNLSDGLDPKVRDKLNWMVQVLNAKTSIDGATTQVIIDSVTSNIDIDAIIQAALLRAYPIGTLIFTNNLNDSRLGLPGTTWRQIKDVFIMAAGDIYSVGETGGTDEITIETENLPYVFADESLQTGTESHLIADDQEKAPIDILNPYLAKYVFERIS